MIFCPLMIYDFLPPLIYDSVSDSLPFKSQFECVLQTWWCNTQWLHWNKLFHWWRNLFQFKWINCVLFNLHVPQELNSFVFLRNYLIFLSHKARDISNAFPRWLLNSKIKCDILSNMGRIQLLCIIYISAYKPVNWSILLQCSIVVEKQAEKLKRTQWCKL